LNLSPKKKKGKRRKGKANSLSAQQMGRRKGERKNRTISRVPSKCPKKKKKGKRSKRRKEGKLPQSYLAGKKKREKKKCITLSIPRERRKERTPDSRGRKGIQRVYSSCAKGGKERGREDTRFFPPGRKGGKRKKGGENSEGGGKNGKSLGRSCRKKRKKERNGPLLSMKRKEGRECKERKEKTEDSRRTAFSSGMKKRKRGEGKKKDCGPRCAPVPRKKRREKEVRRIPSSAPAAEEKGEQRSI